MFSSSSSKLVSVLFSDEMSIYLISLSERGRIYREEAPISDQNTLYSIICAILPKRCLMNLLEKLESALNNLLYLLGKQLHRAYLKVIPGRLRTFFTQVGHIIQTFILWIKNSPKWIVQKTVASFHSIKTNLLTFNFKEKIQTTYKAAMVEYMPSGKSGKLSSFKKIFLMPFLVIGQWVKGLTPGQTLLLFSFTAASFLSGVNILFSGQRIMSHHMYDGRTPASIEEENLYDRPSYYKRTTRHLGITSLRLPVYYANVNELRSIDIDFTATLSNRLARMKLEKLEFQLRDHLIINVEPMLASFPLEDEGKDILKHKLIMEINEFLHRHQIEGEVFDLKLTYILAN